MKHIPQYVSSGAAIFFVNLAFFHFLDFWGLSTLIFSIRTCNTLFLCCGTKYLGLQSKKFLLLQNKIFIPCLNHFLLTGLNILWHYTSCLKLCLGSGKYVLFLSGFKKNHFWSWQRKVFKLNWLFCVKRKWWFKILEKCLVYYRGGQTFLFAGQIWKLFFIEGLKGKKIWANFSFSGHFLNAYREQKWTIFNNLQVTKMFKSRKKKLEGRSLAMSGNVTNSCWFSGS